MGDSRYDNREDIFSNPVRAGKRTYFFDVKATRGDDYYITITESKRRMGDNGRFIYDKHKVFLYKEDFEKFSDGLNSCIDFIRDAKGNDNNDNNGAVEQTESNKDIATEENAGNTANDPTEVDDQKLKQDSFSDIDFDDLGSGNSEE